MTLMAANDARARLAMLNAKGRIMVSCRTTRELCDMYVAAMAQRAVSTGDDARAASLTIGWISEELEERDPAAVRKWVRAEEGIERRLISHDKWVEGASDLAPHSFFGCDQPPA